MAMCSAYLDASGKLFGSAALTVSGFVAPVEKWKRFDVEWQKVLAAEGIDLFHMTDFASSNRQFKTWKGDHKRHKRLTESLCHVIKRNTNKMLSVGVEIGAWNIVNQRYMLEEAFHSPYALAGLKAVQLSTKWAKKKGHQHPVEVFFEDGDEGKGGLVKILGFEKVTPIFLSKKQASPFQAADFVAWKQRNAMRNSMKCETAIYMDPDVKHVHAIMDEYVSLLTDTPNTGGFMIFGKARLIDACKNNGIPKRKPL